ncbi:hypothetical protein [Luteimonas abyssi]|uniref:hypothetical protein n=1 Tax=Luteimonas abyssi TaxID=1247514 RepID=UPI000737B64D|nr:hypothetical protein [Luteimonas abyssi]
MTGPAFGWVAAWLVWAAFSSHGHAAAADINPAMGCGQMEEIANRDGSRLRLHVTCGPSGEIRTRVTRAAPGDDAFHLVLDDPQAESDSAGTLVRRVAFTDVDEDGFHDVEVIGTCGAGPNCLATIYRLEPSSGRFYTFFSGGYADLWIMDGHVVEAGRASCCAWEYHAWPIQPGPPLRVSDRMAFRAVVSVDGEHDGVDCRFLQRMPDGEEALMLPPDDAWLKICEHYGDAYRLADPGA